MKKQSLMRYFLGKPSGLSHFSFFNIWKRSGSTIVMPISLPDKSLTSEHKLLLDEYREKRNEFDALLKQEVMKGISKFNSHEYMQSLAHFDKVIAFASGDSISRLSTEEKNILSSAYAYKANVLSHGSSDDRKMALAHAHLALELNPKDKMAIECENSIQSESNIDYDMDCHDHELGLFDKKT